MSKPTSSKRGAASKRIGSMSYRKNLLFVDHETLAILPGPRPPVALRRASLESRSLPKPERRDLRAKPRQPTQNSLV